VLASINSGAIGINSFSSGFISGAVPLNILGMDFNYASGVLAGMSGMSGHSLYNAARKLTNTWDLTTRSGNVSVFREDGTSVAYSQTFGSTSGAAPVTSLSD
jgi:hypothetical protein